MGKATVKRACKYGDASCPCQDGDMCHYEGPNPMPRNQPQPAAREIVRDARLSGVLIALAVVYAHDQETIADEIITAMGSADLLRVAIAEEDYILPKLRKTIRERPQPSAVGTSAPSVIAPSSKVDARPAEAGRPSLGQIRPMDHLQWIVRWASAKEIGAMCSLVENDVMEFQAKRGAFSVSELKPIDAAELTQLYDTFSSKTTFRAGIAAVLRAAGLEVKGE